MFLVIWFPVLSIEHPLWAIERHFLVEIVSYVHADFVLVVELFVFALWLVEGLLHGFFFAHFLVIIVATNFFDFVAQFGMEIKHICKLIKCHLLAFVVLLGAVCVVDMCLSV